MADLENILDSGVRVTLYYGDADYICNWFGGQAISLALKYKNSKEFANAGYEAFTWGGVEYGEVREYGNFSFIRVYEAGHEVPFYQRKLTAQRHELAIGTDQSPNSARLPSLLQPHHQLPQHRRRH